MPDSPRPLHGKTAWVTGASRGIGRAIANRLAREGASVVLGARTTAQVESEAAILRDLGHKAHALPLDVAEWMSCEAFAAAAREVFGPPDILVNNAGVGTFRPVELFTPHEFEHQFRVNVFGTFYMTRLAVPMMIEAGAGHIVNIGSLAGESDAPMGAGYFASKWALNGFTRCLLQDVRDKGVRVTLVAPGSVDTGFHHASHPNSHAKDQSWMVDPADVAATVLHVLLLPAEALVSKVDVRPARVPLARG
jgi:NAD(P)-dependent dehydrogenase (short-subunit alcohol dehydrogenase family)